MEIQGTWTKDSDGFMEFSPASLQRLYEVITDDYHQVYNYYLEELDEEEAHYRALADGYEMVNDYKVIANQEEFATTYRTPTYVLDIWYKIDPITRKRIYDQGFMRITRRPN